MTNSDYKIEKLSSNNYNTWKVVVQAQLKGKDLWEYIVQPKVEEDADRVENEKAKAINQGTYRKQVS